MAQTVKNLPAMDEMRPAWVRKIPEWHSTPEFLPGESHEQRRLADYNPRAHKESDTTEQLSKHMCANKGILDTGRIHNIEKKMNVEFDVLEACNFTTSLFSLTVNQCYILNVKIN